MIARTLDLILLLYLFAGSTATSLPNLAGGTSSGLKTPTTRQEPSRERGAVVQLDLTRLEKRRVEKRDVEAGTGAIGLGDALDM